MTLVANPHKGLGIAALADVSFPTSPDEIGQMLGLCPAHRATDLGINASMAEKLAVGELWLKREDQRMGLGSFKALGASFVIALAARKALESHPDATPQQWQSALAGKTFACASAGNHGLSLAAGARLFGAKSVVVLSHNVPKSFGARLESFGAVVEWAGDDYQGSLDHALAETEKNGWTLVQDGSWDGYMDVPATIMHGYSQCAHETVMQFAEMGVAPPTHVFLQAGVGGLAAAAAEVFRTAWGEAVKLIVVEPDAAPALQASIEQGGMTTVEGPVSVMGRLDCKTPSVLALASLARVADGFMTVSDSVSEQVTSYMKEAGIDSTPSGLGGLAGAFVLSDAGNQSLGIDEGSRVLCIVSEGDD